VKNYTLRGTLVAALIAPLALAACSHDSQTKVAKPRPSATSTSPTPTTSSPPPTPVVSLLSGRKDKKTGPVYAVKVDNTTKAHPQAGVRLADVVYVEQVEGGVTRLAAVFSSEYPKYVGPVRSARITDIDLLRQYGSVGLMYSGSQDRLLPRLRESALKLVSFDASPYGYTRVHGRPMPYDVIGTFATLRKRAGKVSTPTSVGYTFGPAPAGGRAAHSVSIRYPSARLGAEWAPKQKRWLISMDGLKDMAAEGGQLGPTTLVVQFATVRPSVYHDVNGANTPLTETIGHGAALFFRDGTVYNGSWSRTKAKSPTTYTFAGGKQAVFAPGQIWVALIGRGRPVSVR
jgi:hypothetical protein